MHTRRRRNTRTRRSQKVRIFTSYISSNSSHRKERQNELKPLKEFYTKVKSRISEPISSETYPIILFYSVRLTSTPNILLAFRGAYNGGNG